VRILTKKRSKESKRRRKLTRNSNRITAVRKLLINKIQQQGPYVRPYIVVFSTLFPSPIQSNAGDVYPEIHVSGREENSHCHCRDYIFCFRYYVQKQRT
jgi:hypothetical protein